MCAGDRFMTHGEDLSGAAHLPQLGSHHQRVRRRTGVGDAHGGTAVLHHLVVQLHQLLDAGLLLVAQLGLGELALGDILKAELDSFIALFL